MIGHDAKLRVCVYVSRFYSARSENRSVMRLTRWEVSRIVRIEECFLFRGWTGCRYQEGRDGRYVDEWWVGGRGVMG